jgi:hypothetical protein
MVPNARHLRHQQQILEPLLGARNTQQVASPRAWRPAEDAVLVQHVLAVDTEMDDAAAAVRGELDGGDEVAERAEGRDGAVGGVEGGGVLVEGAVVGA